MKPAAGEDGVDAVAVLAREVVAVHSMVDLGVADHRLDGGAPLHSRGPQVPAWRLDSVARVAGGLRLAWLADRLDPRGGMADGPLRLRRRITNKLLGSDDRSPFCLRK